MTLLLRTGTPCLSSPQLSSFLRGPPYSPSLICATPITWSGSARGTSGRQRSIPPLVTTSTWWCPSASPTLLLFSSLWWMTCSETCSTGSSSSTLMTFWSSPAPRRNMYITSRRSSNVSWRTPCLSKPKNVSFTPRLSPSWGTSWGEGPWRWTQPRFRPSPLGPPLIPVSSFNGSWVLPTSTGGSSGATVRWRPPSQLLPPPRCLFSGPRPPPKTSPDPAPALPTVCSFRLTSGPRFYNGPTALNLPVIQGSNGPRTSYSAGSGGRHWMRTFGVSSRPVPPATSTSRLTMPLPVFYILCLCLIVPGHTFLWTSSPVYHRPAATLLSWRW